MTVAALAFALAFSATFAGSAVAVPNVVDQYTEQFPSPTGPGTTLPGHPDGRQHSGPTAGNGPDSGLLDWLSAIGAPVSSGAGPNALKPGDADFGQGPAGSSSDLELDQARDPRDLPGAQPAPQTETGGIGSGMGIVFPAILLLVTVAAVTSLFVRRGGRGQAGQE